MSDHKTMKDPSLWVPERDLVLLAAVGKLGEEASELCKICFRITIQAIDGVDPETGKRNLDALAEEIADVRGLSELVIRHVHLDQGAIAERAEIKRAHKSKWMDMISSMLGAWERYQNITGGSFSFEEWLANYRARNGR